MSFRLPRGAHFHIETLAKDGDGRIFLSFVCFDSFDIEKKRQKVAKEADMTPSH